MFSRADLTTRQAQGPGGEVIRARLIPTLQRDEPELTEPLVRAEDLLALQAGARRQAAGGTWERKQPAPRPGKQERREELTGTHQSTRIYWGPVWTGSVGKTRQRWPDPPPRQTRVMLGGLDAVPCWTTTPRDPARGDKMTHSLPGIEHMSQQIRDVLLRQRQAASCVSMLKVNFHHKVLHRHLPRPPSWGQLRREHLC